MSRRASRRGTTIAALALFLGLVGSGCLGIPVSPAGTQDEEGPTWEQWDDDPVDAPGWRVGDAWRYRVSGSLLLRTETVTVGVVEAGPDGYKVATDSAAESARALAGAGGILVGNVDPVTLAPHVDGAPRDLLGLTRAPGESWEVVFMGRSFSMMRSGSISAGAVEFKAAGVAADGRTLTVEYNDEAGWFSLLQYRDSGGGLLLGYGLVAKTNQGGVLHSWDVMEMRRLSALHDRVVQQAFTSDGSADLVLIATTVRPERSVHRTPSSGGSGGDGGLVSQVRDLLGGLLGTSTGTASSGQAVVTVLAPGQERVLDLRTDQGGHTIRTTPDRAGQWQVFASTGGPSVELVVYRVQVMHHTA